MPTKCLVSISLSLLAFGCGDDGDSKSAVPWSDNRTQLITPDGNVKSYAQVSGDDCLTPEGADKDVCIRPQEKCGEQAADVVVDADGTVLDVICYPDGEALTVSEIEAKSGNIAQNANNAVLVLDDEDNGVDLEGNLAVDANNVVVYGAGPDVSVISGDINVDGNNTLVRGVRIKGDVNIVKNDATFLFCVIEGNLTISANNARVFSCEVYGNITISGSNITLTSNRTAGGLAYTGKGLTCESNQSFQDSNEDFMISDNELGNEYSCTVQAKQ